MKKISTSSIKNLMMFRPTITDCASFFDCSEDTISRFISKEFGMTFTEFRERHFGKTRIKLRQKAIEMAMKGDRTLMIFCLKNICAWKDNPDFELETTEVELELVYREPEKAG